MRRLIRWQATLPYLILLSAALIACAALAAGRIHQHEADRWQSHLLDAAQFLADEVRWDEHHDIQSLDDSAIVQSYNAQGLTVIFLTPNGSIIEVLSPDQRPVNDTLSRGMIAQALSKGSTAQVTDQGISVLAVIRGEDDEAIGLLQLSIPQDHYRSRLGWLWGLTAAVIAASSLAGLLLSMIRSDQEKKSVEKLTIAAQQISLGNFQNLEFPEPRNELNNLSQSMQSMALRLGDQISALVSEQAKLSAVLNQMTDGVMITDSDGQVQLLNPAAGRLFSIDENKAVGRSLVEVLRYHQLVDLWKKALHGQHQSTMLEIGPQHMILQVLAIPLKRSLPGSTMMLIQDLTQLRRLETVRRDFISNVSHELRTPLASLKALAETLQEGALEDPPAARRFLLRMETEIDNLTQLVNELLELSRIESGKVPLSFHRIKPYDLLQPAFDRMALQAERAGLELSLDSQPELPAVFADPNRITQVVINLIHNAVKFTPPGGKITISAYQDGQNIVFFVKDTGLGIPRKDLGRIFERFYKTDRARTSGGTGLGLSIARHMIESHGGYIWAESEEEVGSTFYFSLPIA